MLNSLPSIRKSRELGHLKYVDAGFDTEEQKDLVGGTEMKNSRFSFKEVGTRCAKKQLELT